MARRKKANPFAKRASPAARDLWKEWQTLTGNHDPALTGDQLDQRLNSRWYRMKPYLTYREARQAEQAIDAARAAAFYAAAGPILAGPAGPLGGPAAVPPVAVPPVAVPPVAVPPVAVPPVAVPPVAVPPVAVPPVAVPPVAVPPVAVPPVAVPPAAAAPAAAIGVIGQQQHQQQQQGDGEEEVRAKDFSPRSTPVMSSDEDEDVNDENEGEGATNDFSRQNEEHGPGIAGQTLASDVDNPRDRILEGDASTDEMDKMDKLDKEAMLTDAARPLRFDPDDGWRKGWDPEGVYLGHGGYGVATLYCRVRRGRIADRVVVKEVNMLHDSNWTSFHKWYGDVRDASKRTPMEIKCMEVIEGRTGADKCIGLRGRGWTRGEMHNNDLSHRIYMYFCPHKTLDHLINDSESPICLLPEPALWSIFNDLVNACLLLQYGADKEGKEPKKWEPIVHRDIKLVNVLLDTPESRLDKNFPSYPTAKLGDFGIAIMTDENDTNNPMAYNDGGTPYWQASEQLRFRNRKTYRRLPAKKLGEKTNVWGIGACVLRLMSNDPTPTSPSFQNGDDVPLSHNLKFSSELIALVRKCVRFDPDRRPSLRGISKEIWKCTSEDYEDDLAQGMRTRKHEASDENLIFPYESDEYKIGMASTEWEAKKEWEEGKSGDRKRQKI